MQAPIIVYKETELAIIDKINEALSNGLPLFCIEAMVKNIFAEIQQQVAVQYEAAKQADAQAQQQQADANEETTRA